MAANYKEGGMFVRNFADRIIKKVGPRLPASEEERAGAIEIAKEMEEATGKKAVIDKFKCAPYASIGAIPVLGVMGFVSAIMYCLHPIASLVTSLGTLLYAIIQVFLYKGWFDKLFPQKESTNVYSVIDGGEKIDYTIVFSGHNDSSWNWNHANGKHPTMLIIKTVIGVVGVVAVLVASIVRIILGAVVDRDFFRLSFNGPLNIIFALIPIIFLIGFYWLCMFLSYNKEIASPGAMDNLTGVGFSILMGKHYIENPDELPKNCRIIVAGLGAEEAGLKGSLAFMEQHKDDKELLINPYFINLDSFRDYDHFNVVVGDAWLGSKFDPDLIELCMQSMQECGLNKAKKIKNPVGGCDSTPIARAGYKTVTLNAQNPTTTNYYHTYEDTVEGLNDATLEKTYELLLNVANKLHDLNK